MTEHAGVDVRISSSRIFARYLLIDCCSPSSRALVAGISPCPIAIPLFTFQYISRGILRVPLRYIEEIPR